MTPRLRYDVLSCLPVVVLFYVIAMGAGCWRMPTAPGFRSKLSSRVPRLAPSGFNPFRMEMPHD